MPNSAQVSDAVLAHGSFSSDLSWAPVLDGLQAGGLTPHPVCLPGPGRRSHEASPKIDLYVHAQSIVEYVHQHDLRRVMLVGHNVIAEQPEALVDILLAAASGDR